MVDYVFDIESYRRTAAAAVCVQPGQHRVAIIHDLGQAALGVGREAGRPRVLATIVIRTLHTAHQGRSQVCPMVRCCFIAA